MQVEGSDYREVGGDVLGLGIMEMYLECVRSYMDTYICQNVTCTLKMGTSNYM